MVDEYQPKLGPKEGPYVVAWIDERGKEQLEERIYLRKHKAFRRRDTLRRKGLDAYVIGMHRIVDDDSIVRNKDEVESDS